MRISAFIFFSLATTSSAAPSGAQLDAGGSRPQIVSIDFVKARPGQRALLIRFYQLNWSRARATILAKREIVSYRMLVSADTSSQWDVALETTYQDSASYARREALFKPVLDAQGLTVVEGKRRADLAEIVGSRLMTVDQF